MVRDPLIQAQDWISAGASRVVVHMGSVDDYVDVITKLYSMYAMPGNLIQTDIIVAVPFDVHIEQIRPIATCISGIQIMGISPVGVQGSALRPEVYATIKTIHSTFPSIPLSVDGGVKEPLIEKLVAAGASYIVMGSAIFGHEHPRGVLRDLCNTYNSV